ncbi:hypothetical protein ACFLU6_16320 [Acidobacteriota bacterium]
MEELDVQLGFEEGDQVEIVSVVSDHDPLAAGHAIVIVGASALSDDALVEIFEPEEKETGDPDKEENEETAARDKEDKEDQ